MPVVEAMTCGAAVLLSAGPTMHEIGRDAALYVDPLSLAHIADTLKRALSDGALRAGSRARVGASGVAHA